MNVSCLSLQNGSEIARVFWLASRSIYNNRIVKMCGHARGLRGRMGGRRRAETGCWPE